MCRCLSYLEKQPCTLAGEHLPKRTAGQLEQDAREALRYKRVPAQTSSLGQMGASVHPPNRDAMIITIAPL